MRVSKPSLGKYLRCAAATRSWRLELEMTRARARRLISTNQYVLFGHHFAAIAGAGPLSGPVLAAQMGYLPGNMDPRRRRVRGRGAGLHHTVRVDAARRAFAWRHD